MTKGYGADMRGSELDTIESLSAEVERLRAALRYQEDRGAVESTHSENCYLFGPKHYECALRLVDRMSLVVEAAIASVNRPEWDGMSEGDVYLEHALQLNGWID